VSFLSYAQNFEDVMLWRALGHIENGRYIDIGAQHPRIDSVSRAFYERGWRGMHVEPVPAFAQMLRADRPDETVFEMALGDSVGTVELDVFADTGLSTAVHDYSERHQAERGYAVEHIRVPLSTVAQTFAFLEQQPVHWMKIDVEGFEEQVLRGWDSRSLRPWIIVVEATIPNSPVTDFESWDPIVLKGGYAFVYFDGLNRFYVAHEHAHLAAAFASPPNVFDAVEVSGLASWGICRTVAIGYEQQAAEASAAAGEAARTAAEALAAANTLAAEAAATAAAEAADLRAKNVQLEASLDARSEQVESLLQRIGELAAGGALNRQELRTQQGRIDEMSGRIAELKQAAMQLTNDLAHARAREHALRSAEDEAAAALRLVEAYRRSTSWRLTSPMRVAVTQSRRFAGFSLRAARWALRQPERVQRRLWSRAGLADVTPLDQSASPAVALAPAAAGALSHAAPMSRRAARVYADLKHAVAKETK
jgi:FkbM family methyltransferase